MDLAAFIRNVPDFPQPGVQFKDITTLLQQPDAFRHVIDTWKERYAERDIDVIVGADARGFIFGSALAYAMGLPFVPIRKKGKLPAETIEVEFELEYGSATFEIHSDAIRNGERILIVDDLLATGGTMEAAINLVRRLGGEVVEIACVIELPPLNARERLNGVPIHCLVEFIVD